MTNVIIHGQLGAIYGKSHNFEVEKLLDITKALNANNAGFKDFIISKFREGFDYVFIDPKDPSKKWLTSEQLQEAEAPSEIHIVPSIGGAGVVAAVAVSVVSAVGVGLAAVGSFLAGGSFLANLAIGMIINGVMSLLFPVELPKAPTQTTESKLDQSSYLFTNLTNNMVQGFPVPLVYGELRIGSNIIGTDIISEDLG